MQARSPRIKQLAHKRQWGSHESFASAYRTTAKELARETGNSALAASVLHRRTYDRWMSGGNTPRGVAAEIVCRMFELPLEMLFVAAGDDEPAGIPSSAGSITLDDPLAIENQLLRLAGGALPDDVLTNFRHSVAGIVDRYEAEGPQRLAGEARMMRSTLHSMLTGQQLPAQRAELMRLTGRAAGLLAYMAVNSGKPEAARAYCEEARTLAQWIGDVELEIWALGTLSLCLYYQGRYEDANTAAAAGVELAPTNPQAIRLLSNGQARALAKLGRTDEAHAALQRAYDLSDKHHIPGGLTPCIAFQPYSLARTLANAMTVHLSLNETSRVFGFGDEIRGVVHRSGSEWSRALVTLDIATAYLQDEHPDVEQAMALGVQALEAARTAPISSVWNRAADLYETANGDNRWHGSREVREYAEHLRLWKSLPPVTQLATRALTV